ncbi:MAG: hypothetical protein IPI97_01760 [Nitrosomonas sp.]|nr:hypothetical protein [Nitrosomonas sp.]MBK7363774.1 hypothetical protein [Nitrosomonas sp.]
MNKSELARNIGISRQMVYKLSSRGMPTDSVETASLWRDRNLNPRYRKEFKTKVRAYLALMNQGMIKY